MRRHLALLRAFARDESGATAVEYGLMIALVAAVIVATVRTLGGKVSGAFEDMDTRWP